jgi:hypothetical protein
MDVVSLWEGVAWEGGSVAGEAVGTFDVEVDIIYPTFTVSRRENETKECYPVVLDTVDSLVRRVTSLGERNQLRENM